MGERKTIADVLAEARGRLTRLTPQEAFKAMSQDALIIDTRSQDLRQEHGVVPGSLHVPRTVLEWRADPDSGYSNPEIGSFDRLLILMCSDGASSSLAAVSLQELGFGRATDVVGGFFAWCDAGLPVRPWTESDRPPLGELAGMGRPTALSDTSGG